MRKLLFVLVFVFAAVCSFSQSLPNYDAIRLELKEDYNAAAETAALKAADFLLTTPNEKDNLDRLKSLQYLIKWMSGTPDYSFSLGDPITKFIKKNEDVLGLYMAAMAKYVLENKADAKDEKKVKLKSVKLLIDYVKDEKNNIKIKGELKKAVEADDKGQLAEYLNN